MGQDNGEKGKGDISLLILSDTHIGVGRGYEHRGFKPYPRLSALVKEITCLKESIDFVFHCGDVAGDKDHHGTREHYECAGELLRSIPYPMYHLTGNHDDGGLLRELFPLPSHEVLLEEDGSHCYRFEMQSRRFLALHSSVPGERAGKLSSTQVEILQSELSTATEPISIFLHHPLLPIGCPWIDETMLVENGVEVHDILQAHREKVCGVFFGHIHQPWHFQRDGISYTCAWPSIFLFASGPNDQESAVKEVSPLGYTLVRIRGDQLQVNFRAVPEQV